MTKTVTIMQPYFLPYIGYWQLMSGVDEFVVYDDIQYTKKGWVNRNRYLVNGEAKYFTLPLKKDSDFLDVRDRYLSDNWSQERRKILARIDGAYRRRPYFQNTMPLIEEIFLYEDGNLFAFIYHSIEKIAGYLGLSTPLIISSTLEVERSTKGAERVKAICKQRGAAVYVNPPGGRDLYDADDFSHSGVTLKFLESEQDYYDQGVDEFVPRLSILDILMNNDMSAVRAMLGNHTFG